METPIVTPKIEQPKNNVLLIVLMSILLLISVSISAYFGFQNQKLANELRMKNEDLRIAATATQKPTAEPVATDSAAIDTSNWKTYTNEKYGFSFKYPAELNQPGNSEYPTIFSYSKEDNKSKSWILYGSISNEKTLDDALNNIQKNSLQQNFDINSIRIADSSAIRYKHCEMACGEILLVSHANTLIEISLYKYIVDISIGEPDAVFDQILSTFKFTN